MNNAFKSLLGAAALVGVSASMAQAADYTWSLSDFTFGGYTTTAEFGTPTKLSDPDGFDGGTASGTFTLRETGNPLAPYTVVDWDIQTTAGNSPTGYAVHYTFDQTDNFGSADSVDNFLASIRFIDDSGDYTFVLVWDALALQDAIDGGETQVPLFNNGNGGDSYETNSSSPQAWTRGTVAYRDSFGSPGQLDLVVPEPASMALLGTGLLGLFAARRRLARAA